MNNTIVGIDLAKEIIQACIYTNKKLRSNKEMTINEFLTFLVNLKSALVVFEACSTSNYWKQKVSSLGHDARIICPKLVHSIRQNQKTDKDDALAVVQSALLPDVNFVSGKNIEQQKKSGVTIMQFCRDNNINPSTFYSWRKRLSDETPPVKKQQVIPFVIHEQAFTQASIIKLTTPTGYQIDFESTLAYQVPCLGYGKINRFNHINLSSDTARKTTQHFKN